MKRDKQLIHSETGATPKKTEEKKGAKVDIPKAEEKKDDPPATGFGDKFKMSAGESVI